MNVTNPPHIIDPTLPYPMQHAQKPQHRCRLQALSTQTQFPFGQPFLAPKIVDKSNIFRRILHNREYEMQLCSERATPVPRGIRRWPNHNPSNLDNSEPRTSHNPNSQQNRGCDSIKISNAFLQKKSLRVLCGQIQFVQIYFVINVGAGPGEREIVGVMTSNFEDTALVQKCDFHVGKLFQDFLSQYTNLRCLHVVAIQNEHVPRYSWQSCHGTLYSPTCLFPKC